MSDKSFRMAIGAIIMFLWCVLCAIGGVTIFNGFAQFLIVTIGSLMIGRIFRVHHIFIDQD